VRSSFSAIPFKFWAGNLPAHVGDLSLTAAALELGYATEAEFGGLADPAKMEG